MADANDPRLVGQTLAPPAVCQAPKGEKSFCTRSLPCEYPPRLPDHLAGRVAGEQEQRAGRRDRLKVRRHRRGELVPSALSLMYIDKYIRYLSCVVSPDSLNNYRKGEGLDPSEEVFLPKYKHRTNAQCYIREAALFRRVIE